MFFVMLAAAGAMGSLVLLLVGLVLRTFESEGAVTVLLVASSAVAICCLVLSLYGTWSISRACALAAF